MQRQAHFSLLDWLIDEAASYNDNFDDEIEFNMNNNHKKHKQYTSNSNLKHNNRNNNLHHEKKSMVIVDLRTN